MEKNKEINFEKESSEIFDANDDGLINEALDLYALADLEDDFKEKLIDTSGQDHSVLPIKADTMILISKFSKV